MLAEWSESCVVDEKSLICPMQTTRLGASADWFNPSIAYQRLFR
jgi:hypothetical protein